MSPASAVEVHVLTVSVDAVCAAIAAISRDGGEVISVCLSPGGIGTREIWWIEPDSRNRGTS